MQRRSPETVRPRGKRYGCDAHATASRVEEEYARRIERQEAEMKLSTKRRARRRALVAIDRSISQALQIRPT
jgi:hypothetical protein